jgi:hypothetical protein
MQAQPMQDQLTALCGRLVLARKSYDVKKMLAITDEIAKLLAETEQSKKLFKDKREQG